jgi:hypothetical protein
MYQKNNSNFNDFDKHSLLLYELLYEIFSP